MCFLAQESQVGLITGLADYIHSHAPQASSMPAATYDDLFGGPWANNRKHEATHRQLSKSIGESLRGERGRGFSEFWIYRLFIDMDFSAYLLLYGITFYNVTDEAIERLDNGHSW